MSDDAAEALRWAGEYAEQNVDLFEVLSIDALTPKQDIHRAWRKATLKAHSDKGGDTALWDLIGRARDILSDDAARAKYESAMKAKLLRQQEVDAMDKERRAFVDDLERREEAARIQREQKTAKDREAMEKESARLAEAQRMRSEELKRQAEADQEMKDLAEAKRRVKEKKDEKARRKSAKESMKAAGRPTGPVNGVVLVPGDYMVDLGAVKKQYWELVCDKLKAIQNARNLARSDATDDEVQQAEGSVQEARRRIAEAESKFKQETAAA